MVYVDYSDLNNKIETFILKLEPSFSMFQKHSPTMLAEKNTKREKRKEGKRWCTMEPTALGLDRRGGLSGPDQFS